MAANLFIIMKVVYASKLRETTMLIKNYCFSSLFKINVFHNIKPYIYQTIHRVTLTREYSFV